MINVLIVDDSTVARLTIREILKEDPGIRVVGDVPDGKAALRFLETQKHLKPDVITMDVIMPEMDGFETTRKIMETHPTPIVIVTSSFEPEETEKTFQAMEAGAVTILRKPGSITREEFEITSRELRETVKVMAGVKVVRRWPRKKTQPLSPVPPTIQAPLSTNIRLIAMGASTGGPTAIQQVLAMLPPELPVPILVVQHIGGEFIGGMVRWLEKTTGFQVHLALNGREMLAGNVYMALDDFHIGVREANIIELSRSQPEEGLRPSVSYLFRSIARTHGPNAVGVLLTGMGRDGAQGLKVMRDAGAHTIAQDEQTSMIFGMPGEAVKLGGAGHILPLKEIAPKIQQIIGSAHLKAHTSIKKEMKDGKI